MLPYSKGYKGCTRLTINVLTRVAQVDDRLEQFRAAIRQDALEMALTVQRVSQELQHQGQGIEQISHTLYDMVQAKVDHLEDRFQKFTEFTHASNGNNRQK